MQKPIPNVGFFFRFFSCACVCVRVSLNTKYKYTFGVIQAADNDLCFAALFSYGMKGVFDKFSTRTLACSVVGVSPVPVVDLTHGNGNDGHALINCQFYLLQGDNVVDLGVYAVGSFNPAFRVMAIRTMVISTTRYCLKEGGKGAFKLPGCGLDAR